MSKNTKHLPIYKASYELVKLLTDAARNFSRDFRPTLGLTINREAVDLVLYVYRANAAENKTELIKQVLEKIQVLEMLVQMSFDLKLISMKIYIACIEITDSISNQAGGWLKYANKGRIAQQSTDRRRPDSECATVRSAAP